LAQIISKVTFNFIFVRTTLLPLKNNCTLKIATTLALCTNYDDASHTIRSQVAYCRWSSNYVYSGVCSAGGETGCNFNANPNNVWAKEANGTSNHYRGNLNDKWYYGSNYSGNPFSVRCVVALAG